METGLHQVVCQAHSNIAHKGRDKYINPNCSIHEEQKSITSGQKQPVLAPIQARGCRTHVQMDLMDLRNVPCRCSCHRKHDWILHMIDHFTKYSWLYPLKNKQAEDALQCLSQLRWQFGFPQKIHTDNGREFKNSLKSQFCKNNGIAQLQGAPRKPSTQGSVERNYQTVKQNIRNILKEKKKVKIIGVR